jgi:GrpB-like predicted nucleotidyltransferase (UPF0157 family)
MKLLAPDQYQQAAESAFSVVREALTRALPFARVEHVGSSSIPGAISKGDVDICVIVDAPMHQAATSTLEKIGYTLKPDTLRTPELCMLESPNTDIDLALQVIAKGSKFEFFMTFRDALRNDPLLVQKYNEIKLRHETLDAAQYRAAKGEFIEEVLRGA